LTHRPLEATYDALGTKIVDIGDAKVFRFGSRTIIDFDVILQ
jgi:hypothetical protein